MDGAISSVLQIGSTPNAFRCSSMNRRSAKRTPSFAERAVEIPLPGSGLPSSRERGRRKIRARHCPWDQWRTMARPSSGSHRAMVSRTSGISRPRPAEVRAPRAHARSPLGSHQWCLNGSLRAFPAKAWPSRSPPSRWTWRIQNGSTVRRTTQLARDRHQREPLRVDIHRGVPSAAAPRVHGTQAITASRSSSLVAVQ